MYGEILGLRDLVWGLVAVLGIIVVGITWRARWIPRWMLLTFLAYKLILGLSFSIWALVTSQDFDARGYYFLGQEASQSLKSFVRGDSSAFLTDFSLFSFDGDSTTKLGDLTGLIEVATGESFVACTVVLAVAGSIGQLLIFRTVRERFPEIRVMYLAPILFHPSLTLWSGMLLKDSLGILALGVSIYYIDRCISGFKVHYLAIIMGGAWIAFSFRAFILLMVVIYAAFTIWDRKIRAMGANRSVAIMIGILYWYIAACAAGAAAYYFINKKGAEFVELQRAYNTGYAEIEGGSTFRNRDLSLSLDSLFILPSGVVNALCRPFVWEIGKVNQAFAAIENTVVLGVVFYGWWTYLVVMSRSSRANIRPFMYGTLLTALVCAVGVGLYSSNLGSISRYRIPGIPFLIGGACVALGVRNLEQRRGALGVRAFQH